MHQHPTSPHSCGLWNTARAATLGVMLLGGAACGAPATTALDAIHQDTTSDAATDALSDASVDTGGDCDCADVLAAEGLLSDAPLLDVPAADVPPAVAVTEVCGDAADNDFDGQTDEDGSVGCTNWYTDADQDQFGTGVGTCTCNDPGAGYATAGGDCNDFNSSIHPGPTTQLEICDNIDNNCNGSTDEPGAKGCKVLYTDLDGDGYGDDADTACLCEGNAGAKWIKQGGDCNDDPLSGGAKIHPGVTEKCDGKFETKIQPNGDVVTQWVAIDDDCDGKTDEQGAEGGTVYYLDQDNDGFGVTYTGLLLCYPTFNNKVIQPGDCDDGDVSINPQSAETCDGIDNDCNGKTDDGAAMDECPGGACVGGKCS